MIAGILRGCRSYFGVFRLLSKLKLWKFFAVPMFLSLLLFLMILGCCFGFSDSIGNSITSYWIWDLGKETISAVSSVLAVFVMLLMGFLLFKYSIVIVSAPFMGPISEKIEAHLTGKIAQTKTTSSTALILRGIRLSCRNFIREVFLTVLILLLGFIPIIGIFSTLLLVFVQAYFVGFGNMDSTLERHFSYRQSISFVKKNKGIAIGNGVVFMLFLLIPVVGVLLVLPFSVTAASLATVPLIEAQDHR